MKYKHHLSITSIPTNLGVFYVNTLLFSQMLDAFDLIYV